MGEINGGDHASPQTAASKGASAQNTPEVELMAVAPGKKVPVAVIMSMPVYKIKSGTQEVYDVPSETTKFVDDFVVRRGYQREGAR